MPRKFERADNKGKEVAERYGLSEIDGGFRTRDKANAAISDACVAFLSTKPMTGKGTMSTINMFVENEHKFVVLTKPDDADYLIIRKGIQALKPAIVFWDISDDKLQTFTCALQDWLDEWQPSSLMVSGPLEETQPGIERLGATLMMHSLGSAAVPASQKRERCTSVPHFHRARLH